MAKGDRQVIIIKDTNYAEDWVTDLSDNKYYVCVSRTDLNDSYGVYCFRNQFREAFSPGDLVVLEQVYDDDRNLFPYNGNIKLWKKVEEEKQ
jgi:hypothetical protein